jgi:hypothetical protein
MADSLPPPPVFSCDCDEHHPFASLITGQSYTTAVSAEPSAWADSLASDPMSGKARSPEHARLTPRDLPPVTTNGIINNTRHRSLPLPPVGAKAPTTTTTAATPASASPPSLAPPPQVSPRPASFDSASLSTRDWLAAPDHLALIRYDSPASSNGSTDTTVCSVVTPATPPSVPCNLVSFNYFRPMN